MRSIPDRGAHVVITGASGGIGHALARAFDGPERRLTLVGRREAVLTDLAAELQGDARPAVVDLGDPPGDTSWLSEAEAALGPVDVLINNAGICTVEPAQGVSPERIRRLLEVNLHAPLAAIRHVLPGMLERRSGSLITIGSLASYAPAAWYAHYAATKGGLTQHSEARGPTHADPAVQVACRPTAGEPHR